MSESEWISDRGVLCISITPVQGMVAENRNCSYLDVNKTLSLPCPHPSPGMQRARKTIHAEFPLIISGFSGTQRRGIW